MSKPPEAFTAIESAARATAGTFGSGLNRAVFSAEEQLFPASRLVLGAKADADLFGLKPDSAGAERMHTHMFGLDHDQINALTAAAHIGRREGIWSDHQLSDKYLILSAVLGISGFLAPDQARGIIDVIRGLTTRETNGELLGKENMTHQASGAPHKGIDAFADLARNVSTQLIPLNIISLANGHTCEPITDTQRVMHANMRKATGVRAAVLAAGGLVFGLAIPSPVCIPLGIAPAVSALVRGGDIRRLNEIIGGQTPETIKAWQELWKTKPEVIDQFIHHLCVEQVRDKCGQLVGRDINPDRNMNPTARLVSSELLNSLKDVKNVASHREKSGILNQIVVEAAKSGRPLSEVLGLLLGIDQLRRQVHSMLPSKESDLQTLFGQVGTNLSVAVKMVSQDDKLMLGLPVTSRIAIALGPQSTNVYKTERDTALKTWGLTGFDVSQLRTFMDEYNRTSFSAEASGYIDKNRFPGFDAIVAQKPPSHDMIDLCVIASFQDPGHVTNLLNKGMYVVDSDSTKTESNRTRFKINDSTLQAELDAESRVSAVTDPAEAAKRGPTSSDNVFKAMMTLSALKYYRNRNVALQKHFNATEGNTAFFDQARTNLDIASKGIITGILNSFLGSRASLVHLASSQSGDDIDPIKSLFTFMDWAQREYPNDLALLFKNQLETSLDRTGQSKTPNPWSKEISLFMGRIASEKRFGPVIQGIANGHLVTMLDDSLNTHLSTMSTETTDVQNMVHTALGTLPILLSHIDTTSDIDRGRVINSISKYLEACSKPPRTTAALQYAGDHSGVPDVMAVETRRIAMSPTLNSLRTFLSNMTFKRDKLTNGPSRGQKHRDIMVNDIDRLLERLSNPSVRK